MNSLSAHFPIESITDTLGNTVLHFACYGGHLSIVTYLIESMTFRYTLKNKEGLLPMQMAAAGNYVEIVKYLSSLPSSSSSSSSSGSHPDCLGVLVSTNESVIDESIAGFNSFHRAVQNNSLQTVVFLLQNNNNSTDTSSSLVNSFTADGSTALHIACKHGYTELCQQLLLFGANINIANQWDLSPMHYACIGGYTRIVQLLLSGGVPVSYASTTDKGINSNARPYLHTAAQYGRHEIVEMIVRHETFLSSDLLALDCHCKNRIVNICILLLLL